MRIDAHPMRIGRCIRMANPIWKHGLNQRLEKFEIPKVLTLVAEPWTPESGMKINPTK